MFYRLLILAFATLSTTVAIPTWEPAVGSADNGIGSLVPGANHIQALGPARGTGSAPKHLTTSSPYPGVPSNLTLSTNHPSPPLFYISRRQLYQYINDTTIYPVNVLNISSTALAGGRKRSASDGPPEALRGEGSAQATWLYPNGINAVAAWGVDHPLRLEASDTSVASVMRKKTKGKPSGTMTTNGRVYVEGGVWRWRGTMLYYDLGKLTNQGLYFVCPDEEGSSGIYMFLKAVPKPDGCEYLTLHSLPKGALTGQS